MILNIVMLLFFKHGDTQKDVFYVGSLSKL